MVVGFVSLGFITQFCVLQYLGSREGPTTKRQYLTVVIVLKLM